MKHLFFSVAMSFVMLACPTLALGGDPDQEWIDEAEKGKAGSQLHLGMWNESHHNYSEAAKWFKKAAQQGNIPAHYHLGLLYENGQGVHKDYSAAVKWYLTAAEGGSLSAQERLGVLSQKGQGKLKDDTQAYMWFYIATLQNDRLARADLDVLEKTLTPEQISDAQRLAHTWMQLHPEPKIDY